MKSDQTFQLEWDPKVRHKCRQNCGCQSIQELQSLTVFDEQLATGSISITYEHQIPTKFNKDFGSGSGPEGLLALGPLSFITATFRPAIPSATTVVHPNRYAASCFQ